jgi:hypothetical protein
MGQFEAIAVSTPRSAPGAARGLVLGALVSASIATALSSAGVADATCKSVRGTGADSHCTSAPTSFAVRLDKNSSVSAQGFLGGTAAGGNRSNVTAGASPSPGPGNVDTASAIGNPVMAAESMLGTDAFGSYGCEDFVDAAYDRTTTTGISHDAALAFYQSLADRGLDHHEMPVPRGALVFSAGPDGNHVDISRGDGTYVSGGVQGLSPGYGDGHDIQILPTPNLGSWTLYGWVYPPW